MKTTKGNNPRSFNQRQQNNIGRSNYQPRRFRQWNQNNVRDDVDNEGDDEQGINNWDDEEQWDQPPAAFGRSDSGYRFNNPYVNKPNNQVGNNNNKEVVQEIKGDIALLRDAVNNIAKVLGEITKQLNQLIQEQSLNKGKEKEIVLIEVEHEASLTQKPQQSTKKVRVQFNENKKRTHNEDTSDSDSQNNKQNNLAIVSSQILDLNKALLSVTSSLDKINDRISTFDSNNSGNYKNNNRSAVGGS